MIGVGAYARVSDGIVYVYGREAGVFETVHMDRDEERTYRECELGPWSPAPGERVVEARNEYCVTGTVAECRGGTSLVRWMGLTEPQVWRNKHLEPFCV